MNTPCLKVSFHVNSPRKTIKGKLKLELQALFSCSENASGAFEFDQREWTQVVDFRFSALATSVSCNVYSHVVVFDVETHSASDGVHNTFLRARSHALRSFPMKGAILISLLKLFSIPALQPARRESTTCLPVTS